MATKKFIIEVEEGKTQCENCPLDGCKCKIIDGLDCDILNLATMRIKSIEPNCYNLQCLDRNPNKKLKEENEQNKKIYD